jgi:type I restriction enzyme S subunit
MSATKGYIYQLKSSAYVVSHLAGLIPSAKIHSRFARWLFEAVSPTQLIKDPAYPSIRLSDIANLEIPYPPLDEQRRIAAILDQADELRRMRREALVKLEGLTASIFRKMFGDPFAPTEGIDRHCLAALGLVSTGATPKTSEKAMFDGPIPFVTPGDLGHHLPPRRSLTEAGASTVRTVRKGATFVCCIGATIGKMGKAQVKSAFNQQINAVEWDNKIDDDYGFHVLKFYRERIAAWGASTTLPILKKSSFQRIEIPVPPMKLQRQFATAANEVENLLQTMRSEFGRLDALFASIQDRAFKGEL